MNKNLFLRKIGFFLLRWGLTALISFIVLFPLYWIFISSIKPKSEIFSSPIQYIPKIFTLENYRYLIENMKLGEMTWNTLIITGIALVISIVFGTMAAYAFNRYATKGLRIAQAILVFSSFIPVMVTARPLYDFFRKGNLLDTYQGLVMLYSSMLLPFSLVILGNFIREIPVSIEEAAEVDGANLVQKIVYVTVPLLRPAIGTLAIINFVTSLNNLFIPLFFSNRITVLTLGITQVPRTDSLEVPWHYISTMGWIIVFPIIIFISIFEKRIIGGIMAGGVKQ